MLSLRLRDGIITKKILHTSASKCKRMCVGVLTGAALSSIAPKSQQSKNNRTI